MKNIIAALKKESEENIERFTKVVKKDSIDDIKHNKNWPYHTLVHGKTFSKLLDSNSVKIVKEYLIKAFRQREEKHLNVERILIEQISTAEDFTQINVIVEWKKNRTWGSNPNATIKVLRKNGSMDVFNSGSISGCGYDKESTAIAKCLNQCHSVLKILYQKKNKNITKKNNDIFGYGSGYYTLPVFEGGVGTDCFKRIFEGLGYKFEHIAGGKTFDTWMITKK